MAKKTEGTFKLPGGGYLMRYNADPNKVGSLLGIPASNNLLFLNRWKIQISYTKDLSLAEVKRFVDRAVLDSERRSHEKNQSR